MGILRSIFGPSKSEIWSQIARDIDGHFEEGGFFSKDVLRYQSGEWEITLDTFTRSSGNNNSTTYTRMRAPFVNKDSFDFEIYREGLFSPLGRLLGMQDIIIGDSYFDDSFVIKSNSQEKIKRLLHDEKLKDSIHNQPDIHFTIKDDEGWFGQHFPEGVDELYFECRWVLKNERLIKSLFDLFSITLERLVQIDSAYEDDPHVRL